MLLSPAPHSMQLSADADPEEGLYRAAGHDVQELVESESLYFPSGQLSQPPDALGSWPAGHVAASTILTDVSVQLPSQPIVQVFVSEGGLSEEEATYPAKAQVPSPVATNVRRGLEKR